MSVSDIRYKRLGSVTLNVTDLERSREFYTGMVGLEEVPSSADGRVFLRCSDGHHDVVLARAGIPGLKRTSWEMESEAALNAARVHFASLGLPIIDVAPEECAALAIGRAFRTHEPVSGSVFEYYVDPTPSPCPFVPTNTKFMQLGHLVIGSPDFERSERFLVDEMNFRVSDRLTGVGSFMRCHPNPYHHSFGVGRAGAPSFQHLNFMVVDIDDIGRAFNRVRAAGVPIVYGPGRHPQSGSIFLYFLDPDGLTLEYSFGMEEFDEIDPRTARDMALGPGVTDAWGGDPTPQFGAIGNIEPLRT